MTLDAWHIKGAILCEKLGNNFLRDRDNRYKGPGDEGGRQGWKERRPSWPEPGEKAGEMMDPGQGLGAWRAAVIPKAVVGL